MMEKLVSMSSLLSGIIFWPRSDGVLIAHAQWLLGACVTIRPSIFQTILSTITSRLQCDQRSLAICKTSSPPQHTVHRYICDVKTSRHRRWEFNCKQRNLKWRFACKWGPTSFKGCSWAYGFQLSHNPVQSVGHRYIEKVLLPLQ